MKDFMESIVGFMFVCLFIYGIVYVCEHGIQPTINRVWYGPTMQHIKGK